MDKVLQVRVLETLFLKFWALHFFQPSLPSEPYFNEYVAMNKKHNKKINTIISDVSRMSHLEIYILKYSNLNFPDYAY